MKKLYKGSLLHELVNKAKESALSAIQVYNNPIILFKSETYIVLMIIAWTYLLHAYYKTVDIDCRYYDVINGRKKYHRTKKGAFKHWELERCINCAQSPIDNVTSSNLRFLIGLRHEVEHQMTTRIDDFLSGKFQACSLNFNYYIKFLFGDALGLDNHLTFSLQLSSISEEQKDILAEYKGLPNNIKSYVTSFESHLPQEEYDSIKYSYRILFVSKTANNKGQADRVIEFIKSDSPIAETVNKEYALIKETEKPKFIPSQIVNLMKEKGYSTFSVKTHTDLWKDKDAKNPKYNYGTMVAGKQWLWYENWVKETEAYCIANAERLR